MRLKIVFRLALAGAVLLALILLERHYLHAPEAVMDWVRSQPPGRALLPLLLGAAAYMLLLSVPFLPGMELGLFLMAYFGKDGTILVYLGTVGGLNLAYLLGRWLPLRWTPASITEFTATRRPDEQDAFMHYLLNSTRWGARLGKRARSTLTASPYLLLALLLNLPGNFVLGGGGGISMIFGITRTLSWKGFLITVCLATAPIPLLVLLGFMQIENLFGP